MITMIKKQITEIVAICLLALAVSVSTAWAEEGVWPEDAAGSQDIQLLANELKVFPVYRLRRVAVGDPEIADVTVLSERELMLIAKEEGATGLIIWDEAGQRSYNIIVIAKDLEKAAEQIRGLLASSEIRKVSVKKEGDKIYVMGEALNQAEADKVKDILAPFPSAVNLVTAKDRQPLVEIDVEVLEMAFDDYKRLGMDWSQNLPLTYTESSHSDGKAPKLWKVFRWDRDTINANLHFLIKEGKARTLANPKLVAVSGKEASFLVGGEVPYITVETEGRTRVQWKEYGVTLKILPQVNAKNEIRIAMEAEVSDLGENVTASGYEIPKIATRKAQTELFLNEGDTIFLAGLIKNKDTQTINRFPWLSKIPILGEMFKYSYLTDVRTEVVISLSPRIIGEKARPEEVISELAKEEAVLKARRRLAAGQEQDSPHIYYSHMIEDIISQNVAYPDQARQERQEGTVKIDLLLLANGELKELTIKESSGFAALDQAALLAVQEQAPYPSFPSQISEKELRLSVPVVFRGYLNPALPKTP